MNTTIEEEVKDVPLVYPLVSVKLSTTAIVGERLVLNECEEIFNFSQPLAKNELQRLVMEFKDYVQKVIETANSPQARDALQHILDNHRPDPSPPSEDPPSLKGSVTGLDQRTLPSGRRED